MPSVTDQFDPVWPELEEKLLNLFSADALVAVSVEGISVYDAVYALCTARPRPLVDRLIEALNLTIVNRVFGERILPVLSSCNGVDLLSLYSGQFNRFLDAADQLDSCFSYVNRLLLANSADLLEVILGDLHQDPTAHSHLLFMIENKKTVKDMLVLLWRTHLYDALKQKLLSSLFDAIESLRRRNEPTIVENKSLNVLRNVVQSFLVIDTATLSEQANKSTFMLDFEGQLLEGTKKFYKNISDCLVEKNNVPIYLQMIENMIVQEEMLCSELFVTVETAPTGDRVRHLCEAELISNHLAVIQRDFLNHAKNENISVLNLFYRVSSRVDALNPLALDMQRHFSGVGLTELAKPELSEDEKFLVQFHSIYTRFKNVVDKGFNGSSVFVAAVDKSLDEVLNRLSQERDIFSLICDALTITIQNFEESRLEQAMLLFKYLNDKDRFAFQYAKDLANRLLLTSGNSSLEHEKIIISRLKTVGGFELMGKLHKMVNDMELSMDLNSKYRLKNNESLFQAVICTSGVWPLKSQEKKEYYCLPDILREDIDSFTKFYCTVHDGRKLEWLFDFSRAEIRCHGFSRRYDVNLPLSHALLLLKFSVNDTYLPCSSDVHLAEDLASVGLLSPPILADRFYSLNKQFSCNKFKLVFDFESPIYEPLLQKHISDEAGLKKDRIYYMEAQIVKLMKAHKSCSIQQLSEELTRHIRERFVPSYQMIRDAVDVLVSKQYLELGDDGLILYVS